jgi:hypothetical protein
LFELIFYYLWLLFLKIKQLKKMKKIYAAAALFFAALTGANAQLTHVDLVAFVDIEDNTEINPTTGRGISWRSKFYDTNPFDSIPGLAGVCISPNGGSLVEGDKVFWLSPTSNVDADGSAWGFVRTVSADEVEIEPDYDGGLLTLISVNSLLTATDSIESLLNIENYEADSTYFRDLLVNRADLVNGRTYGWYVYCRALPLTTGGTDYTFQDTIPANNFVYIPVIWGQGNSINKISTQYDAMDVFPNPVNNVINYSAEIKKASSFQTIRVIDMMGRAHITVNNGATAAGKLNGTLDIANLAAGTYQIQVITEWGVNATKFVKK